MKTTIWNSIALILLIGLIGGCQEKSDDDFLPAILIGLASGSANNSQEDDSTPPEPANLYFFGPGQKYTFRFHEASDSSCSTPTGDPVYIDHESSGPVELENGKYRISFEEDGPDEGCSDSFEFESSTDYSILEFAPATPIWGISIQKTDLPDCGSQSAMRVFTPESGDITVENENSEACDQAIVSSIPPQDPGASGNTSQYTCVDPGTYDLDTYEWCATITLEASKSYTVMVDGTDFLMAKDPY